MTQSSLWPTTLVALRHGIFSNHQAMTGLEKRLQQILPGCHVDNRSYIWTKPILESGIELAEEVLKHLRRVPLTDRIILVGHSQGGLVCRVAAAAIIKQTELQRAVGRYVGLYNDYNSALLNLQSLPATYRAELSRAVSGLRGVVMLGTPNAGALTYGQLAMQGTVALRTAKKMASLAGMKNFDELTTDKLFNVLQNVKIDSLKYISISGSYCNRYSNNAMAILSALPVISRLAPAMQLPNDGIVEDASVDMNQAPLPTEVEDLPTQYKHHRSYNECIRVSHLTIHSDPNVHPLLNVIRTW